MYKILIVDDEELIRKGLISRISHNGFEFSMVLEAGNGKEAINLIKEYKPNIVITDIRMSEIDGITLVREIKEDYPDIKFIIISGYAEFEYAEQALNMGVLGYILKPISDKDLIKALNRVLKELNQKSEILDNSNKKEILEKYYEDTTLEQKLNEIIHDEKKEKFVSENYIFPKDMNRKLNYVFALINIDGKTFYQSSFKYNEIELAKYAISNIVNSTKSNVDKIIINNYKDVNQLMVILAYHDPNKVLFESDKLLNKVLMEIERYLNFSVTIGVSKVSQYLNNDLYRQAREGIQQRLLDGCGNIYIYENLKIPNEINNYKCEIGLLEKYLERCDVGNIEIILKSIFSGRNLKSISSASLRFTWMEIMNLIIKATTEANCEINFDSSLFEVEVLYKFDTLDEIISYIYTLIIDLLKLEKAVDLNSKSKVKAIIQHIEKHYSEEIAVNDLAYMYAMSPNYFSTLFKRETGKTVINFITEVRVGNACKLLSDTKASVVDISSKVGYQDTQYFFRVFKKITGKTPLEFRKNIIS